MSSKELTPIQLDKRLTDRLIKKGLVSDKDVQKHQASLPDISGNAEVVNIELLAPRGMRATASLRPADTSHDEADDD
ncbi:MAG: hypothetical protein GMKNLPBB_00201 [Myxococcota bacterium]|nr:hypothetical protein [Myxococcota bacterium]